MRERVLNDLPPSDGSVLYWMTSARRLEWNFALDHAISRAKELGVGLSIVEPLRADYPYASSRFHSFVRQGMVAHQEQANKAGVSYVPYLEPAPGVGKGLLRDYAEHVSLIVADDHPGFFFPRMLAAAAKLPVRVEAVDSVGVLPLACSDGPFVSAYQFRRFMQKQILRGLEFPASQPLDAVPGRGVVLDKWTNMELPSFADDVPAVDVRGGPGPARTRMAAIVDNLQHYPERNHPDNEAQSGLSPYLHFGHLSSHEVVAKILQEESWDPGRLGTPRGQRQGWWGLSEGAEAFLDQIITWRELGHMEARHNPKYQQFESLPDWAIQTLRLHQPERTNPYSLQQLEDAETDDEIWNAAQRELVHSGAIQNYLRMLWGKKILEWAPSPETALEWMLHLNDKYALDGRDPNSVSGIMWCFGRYDRAWQERDIFGKVRCMRSANTQRKLHMSDYLKKWGADATS